MHAYGMLLKLFAASVLVLFLGACATTHSNEEFVKSVNFSSLESFSFKHTLISGLKFRESEKILLENLTEQTAVIEMRSRNFTALSESADFYIVAKWRKSISGQPSPFQHIDPVREVLAKNDPHTNFQTYLHLTVEIYESTSGHLFWRKDLPNIFSALQLTEERIIESVQRALTNFPQRIEKDPNLPDIN